MSDETRDEVAFLAVQAQRALDTLDIDTAAESLAAIRELVGEEIDT